MYWQHNITINTVHVIILRFINQSSQISKIPHYNFCEYFLVIRDNINYHDNVAYCDNCSHDVLLREIFISHPYKQCYSV